MSFSETSEKTLDKSSGDRLIHTEKKSGKTVYLRRGQTISPRKVDTTFTNPSCKKRSRPP